jgi:hypothetical protein
MKDGVEKISKKTNENAKGFQNSHVMRRVQGSVAEWQDRGEKEAQRSEFAAEYEARDLRETYRWQSKSQRVKESDLSEGKGCWGIRFARIDGWPKR